MVLIMFKLETYKHTLKPCPFCNSKVEIRRDSGSYGYTPYFYYIKCYLCNIYFQRDGEKWEQGRGHYDISKEACDWLVEKWNTRKGECDLKEYLAGRQELAKDVLLNWNKPTVGKPRKPVSNEDD